MRTLTDVRKEIINLAEELREAEVLRKPRKVSKLRNQIDQLKLLSLYLETNPSESSVIKMRDEVERKIRVHTERLQTWMAGKGGDVKSLKAQYENMVGMTELKHRLKALNYLCS